MKLEALLWLILFLPLLAAGIITLFTLKHRNVSALISIGAIVIGFISTVTFIAVNGWVTGEAAVNWLSIGGLNIDFGLKLDRLSEMMMLIVTGVGGAIHIYSYGYMDHDRSKARFFAFMSLFTFSMAMACSRPGSRILLFAQTSATERIETTGADLCVGERTLLGCYSASIDLQKQSANLVFGGEIPVEALISHCLPLVKIRSGIDLALHPGPKSLKIIVQPQRWS